MEELATTRKDWATFEMKLSDALKTVAAQALDKRIHHKFERVGREFQRAYGTYPNGSQMLWIIIRSFDISRRFNQGYTLNDLLKIKWHGDSWRQMYRFMEEWDTVCHDVLSGGGDNPQLMDTIEEHFVKQLRQHSKHFTIDLHAYDSTPIGTSPHTLTDMENRVRQLIDRLELEDNKMAKAGGPPPKGKGKGKGKGDGAPLPLLAAPGAPPPKGLAKGKSGPCWTCGGPHIQANCPHNTTQLPQTKAPPTAYPKTLYKTPGTPQPKADMPKLPPVPTHPDGTPNYKALLCHGYIAGTCARGDNCMYAHRKATDDDMKRLAITDMINSAKARGTSQQPTNRQGSQPPTTKQQPQDPKGKGEGKTKDKTKTKTKDTTKTKNKTTEPTTRTQSAAPAYTKGPNGEEVRRTMHTREPQGFAPCSFYQQHRCIAGENCA